MNNLPKRAFLFSCKSLLILILLLFITIQKMILNCERCEHGKFVIETYTDNKIYKPTRRAMFTIFLLCKFVNFLQVCTISITRRVSFHKLHTQKYEKHT